MKPRAASKTLSGPRHLRYYPAHRLAAWQPHGVLDDLLLDEIFDWVLKAEKTSQLSFNRFVDLSCLTNIRLTMGHTFAIARERRAKYEGIASVQSAFFCEKVIGFGIARLYETLMEGSPIQARAFRQREAAAQWLGVPLEVLKLKDEPVAANSGL